MAPGPESRLDAPAGSSVPVQRGAGDGDVPESWLLEPDLREQAEHVDRLAADLELVNDLALEGFAGRKWTKFLTELAKYGMAVIGGWIRRRLIFGRCRDRGYGGLPELGREFDEEEVEELTDETVGKALYHFREDVLLKQRWDYRRGATLRTFFIGQCLIRFANIYRRWWGNEVRNHHLLPGDAAVLNLHGAQDIGSDIRAVDGVLADRLMSTIKDPRVRRAMALTAAGWDQVEIAQELSVSRKAVERMIANERSRLRKRMTG